MHEADENTISPDTPILVGAAQHIDRWDGHSSACAPSPQSLMCAATRATLHDCGAAEIAAHIDVVAVIRLFADSLSGIPGAEKFGKCDNLPRYVARENGIMPKRAIYSVVGGQSPQALVNEFAEEIYAGVASAVLLTGAEAIAAAKMALRQDMVLDWSDVSDDDEDMEDRGFGSYFVNGYEIANGIGVPVQTYPLFEHALRARLGQTRAEHAADMAELWHRFSKTATANPYAGFRQERSAEFLSAPSAENYPVSDPYLKWHVAQDAVNQGAALILTSVRKAAELGIPQGKWIYLHGYGAANEKMISERTDLSRSIAAEKSLGLAFESARIMAGDATHMDLYSCFPCAVFIAAEAAGINWRTRQLTLTGGLPFFGGAGNNYSMHAIAEMVMKLRACPNDYGLIVANGGFLSKQAVGIYSARPKPDWQPVSSSGIQAEIDAMQPVAKLEGNITADIESYTLSYKRGRPDRAIISAVTENGRILAHTSSSDANIAAILAKLAKPAHDPIGRKVTIESPENSNIITAIAQ
ncbi:acetyl-CoA acetyltransferase [Sphingorhabdus sp. Alg239-R122]|uniref:acetyl-CoA acetyltransferase n=1 Tax=Sphingorhabdus sp. Alg239-R122 TaxID=2305989 RepID=UPI0013DBBE54|nr:acetyl-CoA acetyltransferase [Sphingorhabdus sp. Alg239-R122]